MMMMMMMVVILIISFTQNYVVGRIGIFGRRSYKPGLLLLHHLYWDRNTWYHSDFSSSNEISERKHTHKKKENVRSVTISIEKRMDWGEACNKLM